MTHYLTAFAMGAALVASAAAAEEPLCAGLPGGGWVGGSFEASDLAVAPEALEAMSIAPVGQSIVSYFTLSAAADLRLEAQGALGSDTIIELFNASGLSIAADDDSGGGLDSRLELSLEAGSYCLQTSSYDQALLSATIRVGRQEHEALTAGIGAVEDVCEVDGAPMLTISDVEGEFHFSETIIPGQNSFVGLVVEQNAPVLIQARNQEADPVLTIFNEAGEQIGYNDDFDGLSAGVEFIEGLETGTYCLLIGAYGDSSLPVSVEVSRFDEEAALLRDYRDGIVPPLDDAYPVTDLGILNGRLAEQVTLGGDALWFVVEMDTAALLRVDAIGQDGDDPMLELFDEFGVSLSQNDDISYEDYSSRLYEELFPGIYYIGMTNNNPEQAQIRLGLRQYVPMPKR